MSWFRSNIRLGSRLALFAVALQVVLSFGHTHLHIFTPHVFASSSAEPSQHVVMGASGTLAEAQNPIYPSNGSDDVDCPICALIQLVATSVPSAAPTFPVLDIIEQSRLEAPAVLLLAFSSQSSFRARAPPVV